MLHSTLPPSLAIMLLVKLFSENHFVPLGPRLTPGLNWFLSEVLPGLEEGSDHYTRTNNLLETVREVNTTREFSVCRGEKNLLLEPWLGCQLRPSI